MRLRASPETSSLPLEAQVQVQMLVQAQLLVATPKTGGGLTAPRGQDRYTLIKSYADKPGHDEFDL
ncbi:uncharacterized protein GLRG_08753 [Colletotrichum graminicola M1.001]|uniref:Uncharacterized protein n=1 Tax=Colletotrichum graminicola (strain M1.001 / M2 / FGSC 10212) TaxID=645133 RepID=E3QRI6_COLGM|nr:uncharacterized protein GLRG_08753 [Colletotrichum graminicola M1.001]EFQ33474.1 hypothetical protein GLRG_08753 [Colletotrichum graminicola M1.001]